MESKPIVNFDDDSGKTSEYQGVDLRFYTENYKLQPVEKKTLVALVATQGFRTFEKYLDWRINAAAHRMKAFLMEGEHAKASIEAAEIDALSKITSDMQNFWNEVKADETARELETEGKITKKSPKVFGDEKLLLNIFES
jgi:hypothetical protein